MAELALAETREVSNKALTIIEQAQVLVVATGADYLVAGELWKTIRDIKKEVDASFDPIVEKARAAWKESLAQKAKIFDPLEMAGKTVKGAMEKYDREQQAIVEAEERRIRELARKQEEERKLQEAIDAEANGEKEVAEAIMEEEVYVPPIIVQKEVPKVNGGPSFRTVWKFRIINPGLIPHEYMQADMVKIGGVVRAMKGQTQIPGVEVYSERC